MDDKQKLFLLHLFSDECKGSVKSAKVKAGYDATTPDSVVIQPIANEVQEATKQYLTQLGVQAAYKMGQIISEDTPMLGLKEKMAAAKDLLDRAGFVKTEKVEVKAESPVFILPRKD
jgi:hypothetical protein